jgi:hypothetical protein
MTIGNNRQDYGSWLKSRLPFPIQKITVNAGMTCPNRDGTVGTGGCIFCNNASFSPRYCQPALTVAQQIEAGKRFFAHKHRRSCSETKFLAYFQAYTNTHAPLERLIALYEEALAQPDVVGLIIGTRPDCMPPALLSYMKELNRRTFLIVEYGIESANDDTLQRINRGHTFAQTCDAIRRTHDSGILVGGHIILGLPGEPPEESLRQAPLISALPLDVLKIHQLQIIRDTPLAREYAEHPFPLYTLQQYIDLLRQYLSLLRSSLIIERIVSQAPSHLLIAPRWGVKNQEVMKQVLLKK